MIRKAELKDAQIIAEYNCKMALETEDLELDKDKVLNGVKHAIEDHSKAEYYLYELEAIVVGQLMITKEWSDWRDSYLWWIQSVYVNKQHRRKGVFGELYKYVENLVEKDPTACGIRLYVEKNNKSAQSTYQKMGMHETHYILYEIEK